MKILQKEAKVFYKLENGQLIGGSLISAKTDEQLADFKEFNSREEACEFFGYKDPEEDKEAQDEHKN